MEDLLSEHPTYKHGVNAMWDVTLCRMLKGYNNSGRTSSITHPEEGGTTFLLISVNFNQATHPRTLCASVTGLGTPNLTKSVTLYPACLLISILYSKGMKKSKWLPKHPVNQSTALHCEIWGFQIVIPHESSLLQCDTVSQGEQFPAFWRNIMPSSSRSSKLGCTQQYPLKLQEPRTLHTIPGDLNLL